MKSRRRPIKQPAKPLYDRDVLGEFADVATSLSSLNVGELEGFIQRMREFIRAAEARVAMLRNEPQLNPSALN